MDKLRDQLEQIFDEQDKLKDDFEKAKLEYIKNSNLVSLRREKLIVEEINKFIDLYCIREENARCNILEFKTKFEEYVNCSINDFITIVYEIGYVKYEADKYKNVSCYVKGLKLK